MRPLLFLFLAIFGPSHAAEVRSPVPAEIRERCGLVPFYGKCVMVGDFPVVSSPKVSNAALLEAAFIVRSMLSGRDDILSVMARNKVRLVVMGVDERTCDVPEHADLTPRAYWNVRARGLGASKECPVVSCGEENLLCSPGDRYPAENIMVHEFAHAIHDTGLASTDKSFDGRLKKAYRAAMKAGKWKDCYAAENHHEYWAEAVQSWFGTNRENDAIHNHVNTRDELKAYDPAVAKLCEETFGNNAWVYQRADDPGRKDEEHLRNLERSKLRPFVLSEEEKQTDREQVRGK